MQSTDKLTAVNAMLATIGEAPINTLENTRVVDAVTAINTLEEVTREILVEGYKFNTDEGFPITPEGFAPFEAPIPKTALSCVPSGEHANYTVREGKIYDPARFSHQFQNHGPITCDIIWYQEFDYLPEVTRQYIALKAGRRFQKRAVGSDILHAITKEDEDAAMWAHRRANTRIRKKSFLLDSQSVRNISSAR